MLRALCYVLLGVAEVLAIGAIKTLGKLRFLAIGAIKTLGKLMCLAIGAIKTLGKPMCLGIGAINNLRRTTPYDLPIGLHVVFMGPYKPYENPCFLFGSNKHLRKA